MLGAYTNCLEQLVKIQNQNYIYVMSYTIV